MKKDNKTLERIVNNSGLLHIFGKEDCILAIPINEPIYIVCSKLDEIDGIIPEKFINQRAPEKANAYVKGMPIFIQDEAIIPVQYYRR